MQPDVIGKHRPGRQRSDHHEFELDVVADRGYFNSTEILACAQTDITVTLPKPMTSGAKSEGRFGKQDFVYLPTEDVYRCPDGVPGLPAQISMYDGTRAAYHAMGARTCGPLADIWRALSPISA
jgi:hypothetical protein